MDKETKQNWLRLREQAGIKDDQTVYSTAKQSSQEIKRKFDENPKNREAKQFNKSTREQRHRSDWVKGRHGTAEKIKV